MPQVVPEFTSPAQTTADNPLEGLKFKLDGVQFECKGELSMLELSELAYKSIADGTSDAATTGSVYKTLSEAFGPEEYVRFKEHHRKYKTSDETIIGIIQWLNEAVQANVEMIAGRPTGRSSSSSGGPEGPAGQPVRSISADRSKVITLDGADVETVASARAGKTATRPPKTRQRTSSRRTG
jgi:hypothetical protein